MVDIIRDPQSNRDYTINGNFIGGLNTEANVLNVPHTDCPNLRNVDLSGGTVSKRTGTNRRTEVANEDSGITSMRLVSDKRVNLTLLKDGTSLFIGTVSTGFNSSLRLSHFPSVWNGREGSPSFVDIPTPEGSSKLILTPNNPPVQVFAYEQRFTGVGPGFSFTYDEDSRMSYISDNKVLVVIINESNGQMTFDNNVTVNTTIRQVTTSYSIPTGSTVILVNLVWQWWAEAYWYYGNRFYAQTQRFGIDQKDRHVFIPETLRDGFDYAMRDGTVFPNSRSLLEVHQRANPTNRGVYTKVTSPTNTDEWNFTNGKSGVIPAASSAMVVGDAKTHVTFGGISLAGKDSSPESASPLHLHRIRVLGFEGGNPFFPALVRVFMGFKSFSGVAQPTYGEVVNKTVGATPASTTFGFSLINTSGVTIGSSTDKVGRAIGFFIGGSTSTGVPPSQIVKIVHFGKSAIRGLSTLNEVTPYKAGCAVPAYGFGDFADYAQAQFPTTGLVANGRLHLAGCSNDPMRIIVSAVTDYNLPGEFFTDFQIDPFGESPGAYDIRAVSIRQGDYIVRLLDQGDVFVYTRNSVQRTRANQEGIIVSLGIVANVGPTSRSACISVEGRMMFIGDSGLYECRQADGLGDSFTVVDLSTKVSRIFKSNTSANQTLVFDSTSKQVYISLSQGQVLVYHLEYQAFSTWSMAYECIVFNGETIAASEASTRLEFLFLVKFKTPPPQLGGGHWVLQKNNGVYLDLVGSSLGPVTGAFWQGPLFPAEQILSSSGIPQTGFDEIDDLKVTNITDGVELVFQKDYFTRGSQIILAKSYNALKTFKVESKFPQYVPLFANDFDWGFNYVSLCSTPQMNFQSAHRLKRVLHTELVFDNRVKGNLYIPTFGSSQPDWRRPPNVNVTFVWEGGGDTQSEIYNPSELQWDVSLFDEVQSGYADRNFTLFRLPIQGLSYMFQMVVWNLAQNPWAWCGYQIVGKMKGNRYQRSL